MPMQTKILKWVFMHSGFLFYSFHTFLQVHLRKVLGNSRDTPLNDSVASIFVRTKKPLIVLCSNCLCAFCRLQAVKQGHWWLCPYLDKCAKRSDGGTSSTYSVRCSCRNNDRCRSILSQFNCSLRITWTDQNHFNVIHKLIVNIRVARLSQC